MELIIDYDYMIEYHPRRANVMVDAFSRKSRVVVIGSDECDEKELLELRKNDAIIKVRLESSLLAHERVKSTFREKSTRSLVKG